jgi:hypothetical protein
LSRFFQEFILDKNRLMFIVVNHAIKNPAYFWGLAQKILPSLPEGGVKRVLNVFPNQNMDLAVCLWEADSVEALDAYLREKVGDASYDSYFEVNQANAIGIEGN